MEITKDEKTLKEKIVAMIEFMRSEKNTPVDVAEEVAKIVEDHYENIFEKLDEAVEDETVMIAQALKIAEYNFLSANYRELKNAQTQVSMMLNSPKLKGDVPLTIQLNKIEHDLGILSPLVQKEGLELTAMIEKKYDFKFKFLTNLDNVKAN